MRTPRHYPVFPHAASVRITPLSLKRPFNSNHSNGQSCTHWHNRETPPTLPLLDKHIGTDPHSQAVPVSLKTSPTETWTNRFTYPPWFNSTRIYHRTQNTRTLFQLFWVQGLPEPGVVSVYSLTHSEFPDMEFIQFVWTHIRFQFPYDVLAMRPTTKKLLFPLLYLKCFCKK